MPTHSILHQDFYATWDLIESTLRMNMVMLADPLLKKREPIATIQQLEEVVNELIEQFNNWEKYVPSTLRSCPSLAVNSDVVELHVSPDADVDTILDQPDSYHKKVKLDEKVRIEEDLVEGMVVDKGKEPRMMDKVETGTYRSYLKGLNVEGNFFLTLIFS